MEGPNHDRKSLKVVGPIPDMVYGILRESGSPLHHKDITTRLVEMLNGPNAAYDARLIARIHTEINLDNRFLHTGQGMWGLKEWTPKRAPATKTASSTATSKAKPKRPDFWRPDDDLDEHPRSEEEESDWPKDEDEPDRPEA